MNKITVDINDTIKSINEALKFIKDDECNEIFIKKGIYHEKIKLTHNNVSLVGEDLNNTIITYKDYAKKIHQDGKEYNTFRTYTLMIRADNIIISNLTIENASGNGDIYGQAVALSTMGDNIYIHHCYLKAYQDTLFLGPLPKDLINRYQGFLPKDELIYYNKHRIYLYDTIIKGDVDFVFGCARAFFYRCNFISLERDGFVFAPSTEKEEDEGFIVINCNFNSNKPIPHVFIARPWRDYGKVILINNKMENHIMDTGFDKWNETSRDKTCRFYEVHSRYYDGHQYNRAYFTKSLDLPQINKYLLEVEQIKRDIIMFDTKMNL